MKSGFRPFQRWRKWLKLAEEQRGRSATGQVFSTGIHGLVPPVSAARPCQAGVAHGLKSVGSGEADDEN